MDQDEERMNERRMSSSMDSTGGGMGGNTGGNEPEVYTGHTEREVAFKLLAAHALVDKEFYYRLREDPAAAAKELYITLEDGDYEYLRSGIEWDRIDPHAEEVRDALHADAVVRSLW